MAEKGFGVKEINLIGASGTPTIESPNNLNLNAVNVAISTNATVGGTLAVTGNVSVGGTLTYEDVTNIDSVGVITARSGVDVDDFISVGSNIHLGNAGVVTATTFSGSGASLTSIPAGNLTGTVADARISTLTASKLSGALPAISGANLTNLPADTPTNSDIQVAYTVTANGSSAYRFAGNGVVSTADDPDLYLMRGQKYRFINNSGGSHPFQIREASGGTAYSTGVTNNGAASGNIDFAPTYDSPAQLVYQCTSHSGMVGNIYLRDAAGANANVGVTTFANKITVESSTNTVANFKGSGGAGFIQITDADDGSLAFIGVDGGAIKLQTSGSSYSDTFIIATDGDIGVGVASPDGRFHIMGGNLGGAGSVTAATTGNALVLESNTSQGMSILVANDERANIYFGTTGTNGETEAGIQYAHEAVSTTADRRAMIFRSGGGERMRIQGDSLRIGDSTTSNSAGKLQVIEESGSDASNDCNAYFETNAGDWNIKTYYNKAGTHYHMVFVEQGSERGRILGNDGSNVQYATGSDYRWKENIVDMSETEGIEIVKKLKPRKFNWIENRTETGQVNTVDGFIAHEVDEAGVLGAVNGEKDAVKADGSIDGQMLDYAQLTPCLAAAIKGLISKVETLEAEVATLKAK